MLKCEILTLWLADCTTAKMPQKAKVVAGSRRLEGLAES
jgi:hypothetical protein